MLKSVKEFFEQNLREEEDISDEKLNLAAAALLFEVGRSDYAVDQTERKKIEKLVKDHFHIDESEIEKIIALAEQEANDATSLHGFTSLIVDHWPEADRIHLAEMMWKVAYADGNLDDHEVHLMRKIQRLLYIPHKQFIAGKLRAKDE